MAWVAGPAGRERKPVRTGFHENQNLQHVPDLLQVLPKCVMWLYEAVV